MHQDLGRTVPSGPKHRWWCSRSALGQGLGCHDSQALCAGKAPCSNSQGFIHSPEGFIRRTQEEKRRAAPATAARPGANPE